MSASVITIPSSINQRLACIAGRIHVAGPAMVLRMMVETVTSSDPMVAFERVAAATLPVPARLVKK